MDQQIYNLGLGSSKILPVEVSIDIQAWHTQGTSLKEAMIDFNWEYRQKVCSKCPLEMQQKLHCMKFPNYKDGIQETHCKKLIQARTRKFKKNIEGFLESHPLRDGI